MCDGLPRYPSAVQPLQESLTASPSFALASTLTTSSWYAPSPLGSTAGECSVAGRATEPVASCSCATF